MCLRNATERQRPILRDRQDDTRARKRPDEASVRARGGMRHARTPLRRVVRPRRSPPEGAKRDTVDRAAGGEPREVERCRPRGRTASPWSPPSPSTYSSLAYFLPSLVSRTRRRAFTDFSSTSVLSFSPSPGRFSPFERPVVHLYSRAPTRASSSSDITSRKAIRERIVYTVLRRAPWVPWNCKSCKETYVKNLIKPVAKL